MTEQEAALWLKERDGFLILTHIRPDGDTLGCAAALCAALKKLGKTAWVAPNAGVTSTYLPYIAPYFAPEGYVHQHVVAVDIATEGLFPPEAECFKGKTELCIDHHPSNEHYAPLLCLDASAAACGEVIYRICADHLKVMDEEIAAALYLAISTDTGCFVYGNTSSETHRIAAQLMKQGDFAYAINQRCFQTKSRKALELESRLVSNAVFLDEGRMVISSTSLQDMAEIGADEGDSENLASLLRQIDGVKAAATLRQLGEDKWKLSLRTDPSYLNATNTCAHLGGGGHAAASGATVEHVTLDKMKELVLRAMQEEKTHP